MSPKILIFAYGNPSRGDDGLAPALLAELTQQQHCDIDLLEDFQLQIEHVLDLIKYQTVIFIDASLNCSEPFSFNTLQASRDDSYSSHAQTPSALLHTCLKHYPQQTPLCYLLEIRGYQFELGEGLSKQAQENMQEAIKHLQDYLEKLKPEIVPS